MPRTQNVSVGKPKISGAIFRAPAGTDLPTDAKTELPAAFKELGYVSDDGMENEDKPSFNEIKEWGGSVIALVKTGKKDDFKLSLVESLNVEVLKTVYGDDNVTGTLETGITVKSNVDEQKESVWVIDMILHGQSLKRIVIPSGKLSDLETIKYKSDELIAYGITISALADASGNSHYEYITSKSAA